MAAPFGLALGERLVLAAVGRRKMVDAGEKRTEEFSVVVHAADRNAAEADAVIGALPADEALARALPAHVVVGERDFQRRVGRFRARAAEEDMVEVSRRQLGKTRGELERQRMGKIEDRRKVELARLALDRLDDGLAVM